LMGQKDKAVYYYKKGQENLIQKENKVYEAKINIIYALLQDNQNEAIEQCWSCIHFLQEKNDLDSVLDLSLIISQYCEE
ncbi:aspartate phosphatase, partial [Bacillus subtilis]